MRQAVRGQVPRKQGLKRIIAEILACQSESRVRGQVPRKQGLKLSWSGYELLSARSEGKFHENKD